MTILDERASLAGPGSSGTVTPFGAQVMSWAPDGEAPVLWMSPRAVLDGSVPVRGGIPVCLPWFGTGPGGAMRPSHGFARTTRWRMLDAEDAPESPGLASRSFRLDHAPVGEDVSAGLFPHRFHALLRVSVTDELVLSLTVVNDDDHAVRIEEALHTYFAVGDVKDVTIDGLEGSDYLDAVRDDGRRRTQVGELALVGPTDRIYRSAAALVLHDPRRRRAITIDKDSSASTIVWNPWAEGAAELSDLGPHDWQDFVCVEVGNVRDDAVSLSPGEEHTLILILHVDPMA
jgi:glucose-6-phosphate 1-epimerase